MQLLFSTNCKKNKKFMVKIDFNINVYKIKIFKIDYKRYHSKKITKNIISNYSMPYFSFETNFIVTIEGIIGRR